MPRPDARISFRDTRLLLGLALVIALVTLAVSWLDAGRTVQTLATATGGLVLALAACAALLVWRALRAVADRADKAEAALARLREALDELPTGLEIYDADDRLLFANKRIAELYPWIGYPLQIGRSFDAILREAIAAGRVPAAAGREEDWLRQRLAKRASHDGPILQSLKGGQWINTYERRTPSNFVVGVRLEVTELVARTNDLQASRERLQAVIGTAAAGIVSTDTQGVILEANTAAATLFNTTVAAILRRPIADWIPALGSRLQADLGGGTGALGHPAPWRDEFDGRDDLDRALRLQVSVSAIGDGAGLEFVIVIGDLTAREHAEGARRLLESQLREAQKMESIGTLASGIAHDFNNVLGSIIGNADLARSDIESGAVERALQELAMIRAAGDRARKLVRQILTFSRHQPLELLVQPLQAVIDEGLDMLRATLPAQVTLDRRLAAAPLMVCIDGTQVQQVLLNLCTNAWHAIGDRKGRVEIGADAFELSAVMAAALGLHAGAHVRLWVADDGSGMSAETRQRIFDPFFTTKPVGAGTGLGLSMAHGIVRSHGGAITVESSPGAGSRFEVYLPAAQLQIAPPPEADKLADAGGRGERVLVIDDDPVMPIMLQRLLERAGYTVDCSDDPASALERLRAAPGHFDAVVTDFNMPGLSGLDLVRSLEILCPRPAVVLTTGLLSDELREQASRLGVCEVLAKEFALERLAPAVRRALDARGPVPGPGGTAQSD